MLKIYYFISTSIVLIYSFFFNKKKLRGVFLEDNESLNELLKSRKSLIRWGDGETKIFFGGDLYFQPNSISLFLSLREIIKTYGENSAYYLALPNAFLNTDKVSLVKSNKYFLWVHTRYLYSKYFKNKKIFFLSSFMFREESNLKNDVIEKLWKTETYIFFLHNNYKYYIDFCEKYPTKKVLFIEVSGAIPPNPTHLLANGNFETLIEEAKSLYDYIVVDLAPTILVTDTLLIAHLADATICAVRANHTEKKLISFSEELSKTNRLKNMIYVINGVEENKYYGYNYNYGYNYGYGGQQES